MDTGIRRIVVAALVLFSVVGLGGVGYLFLGRGVWSLAETIYFAIITVSGVGYGEMHDLGQVGGARVLTGVLILLGSGAMVYFQSNITATLVEGRLGVAFRRKRMKAQIAALREHVVVAGIGSTGKHVVEELEAIQKRYVVIDLDLEKLERLNSELGQGKMLYVHGDATQDVTLMQAGIAHASGVIAALSSDRENLYVTLSARSLNPLARIVAKVVEAEATKKMLIAGANATVSPNIIGGQRLASELIRPEVLEFLDQMMRDKDKNLRLEEVTIPRGSRLVGQSLRQAPFRSAANVLVVAVRDTNGKFIYNPESDYKLQPGTVLIVLGESQSVRKVLDLMRQSLRSPSTLSGA